MVTCIDYLHSNHIYIDEILKSRAVILISTKPISLSIVSMHEPVMKLGVNALDPVHLVHSWLRNSLNVH